MADNPGHQTDRPGKPAEDGRNVLPVEGGRAANDVFLAAVQMTRMAMVLSDPNQPDNPIIFCNSAFCEQTGYPAPEVIGRNCRFLQGAATDRATIRRISQAVAARADITEDIYNYRRDGTGFWNALYVSPIFDTDGKLLYFFGSQVDVTRRKEAALHQQQRSDTVGAMASGVAHAFNNLMTVVVASIDQASIQATSKSQRLQLARAEEAARSAGTLTQQMLSFARRQFLEEHTVDLNGLVADLNGLVIKMTGNRVEFELAARPVLARLDPGQLELALVALVRNAADATPKGERIAVTTREYRSWDAAEGQTGRTWVELAVVDQGDGMLPEVARRATEPFFTTRCNGTGLGLSMVHGFVEQSRGRMRIETEPGQGTTVRLVFPSHADVAE